jgi:ABC-2 type transport system ATP-binding protein
MAVIETEGLGKVYRRIRGGSQVALSGLDLAVPEGGVFGFLGPNGSGKTTTIRCVMGLIRPSSGHARVLGVDAQRELHEVVRRIGSLVEAPTPFPTFSGRRNLMLLARIDGIGRARVDAVLDRVGLAPRADDLVRAYSLGMRQRLGIAAALLRDPELLILDEPANGLDPAGIKEIRDLLRALGTEGRTVFVSSHLLNEVQQICDQVAILSHGRCIASGPVADVLTRGRHESMLVRVEPLDRAAEVLRTAGITVTVDDGGVLKAAVPSSEAARVTRALANAGLYLSELRPEAVSLETVFLELTGEELA